MGGANDSVERLKSCVSLFDDPHPPTHPHPSLSNPHQNVRGDARWIRNLCKPAASPQAMPHMSGTRKQGAVSMMLESLEKKEPVEGGEEVEAEEAQDEDSCAVLDIVLLLPVYLCGV